MCLSEKYGIWRYERLVAVRSAARRPHRQIPDLGGEKLSTWPERTRKHGPQRVETLGVRHSAFGYSECTGRSRKDQKELRTFNGSGYPGPLHLHLGGQAVRFDSIYGDYSYLIMGNAPLMIACIAPSAVVRQSPTDIHEPHRDQHDIRRRRRRNARQWNRRRCQKRCLGPHKKRNRNKNQTPIGTTPPGDSRDCAVESPMLLPAFQRNRNSKLSGAAAAVVGGVGRDVIALGPQAWEQLSNP